MANPRDIDPRRRLPLVAANGRIVVMAMFGLDAFFQGKTGFVMLVGLVDRVNPPGIVAMPGDVDDVRAWLTRVAGFTADEAQVIINCARDTELGYANRFRQVLRPAEVAHGG